MYWRGIIWPFFFKKKSLTVHQMHIEEKHRLVDIYGISQKSET